VHLVSGRYLLDRPVATQRLKRDRGLEIRRKPGPPPKKWSTVIVSKRRIRNGEQTSQTRRNSDEVAAG